MKIDCFSAGILVADHLCSPIERMPAAGELVLADSLPLQIGGCASNLAVNLAGLGVRVGVQGCVGHDPFGQFIIDTLRAAGVETGAIRRVAEFGTSGTLIVNVLGEDRRFIHTIGANAALRAEDIPRERVFAAKVFYVGGYLLMPSLRQEALAELFRDARAAGVKTVLDVVLPGAGEHWNELRRLLAETDVFLPNRDEAAAITGHADPLRQAQQFLDAGAGAVAITAGEEGTWLVTPRQRFKAGAYPAPFVGGAGAGDAFDAGYICGMLEDLDPLECLRLGSAFGAKLRARRGRDRNRVQSRRGAGVHRVASVDDRGDLTSTCFRCNCRICRNAIHPAGCGRRDIASS